MRHNACGGIAQLARANGSYPLGQWFESTCRYQYGPLVKRLRHRPFTAKIGVRFSYGSPFWEHSSAGRASALQAEGHRFDPYCSHHVGAGFISLALIFLPIHSLLKKLVNFWKVIVKKE